TPGTVLEEASLDPSSASFLAVLTFGDDSYARAVADVSTGDLRVAEFPSAPGAGDGGPRGAGAVLDAVAEEIARLGVKELVLPASLDASDGVRDRLGDVFRSVVADAVCDGADASAWLAGYDAAVPAFGGAALAALGGMRSYLRDTCRATLHHLRVPELYHPRYTLILDQTTRANLALV